VFRAVEIDYGRVDVAGTARACISDDRRQTISVSTNEEEMISAVCPDVNAGLCDAGGGAEDKDAPRFASRSL
jgi:hypothetical protein